MDLTLLKQAGVSRKILVTLFGVSGVTASQWRNGRTRPTFGPVVKKMETLLRVVQTRLNEGRLPAPPTYDAAERHVYTLQLLREGLREANEPTA